MPNKFPMLFSITKGDKVSLLLGTNHALPIDHFDSQVKDILLGCSHFVTEQSKSDNANALLASCLRKPEDEDWYELLPEDIKLFITDKVDQYYLRVNQPSERRISMNKLSLWMAFQCICQVLMADMISPHTEEKPLCMDLQLIEIFEKKNGLVYGLEDIMDQFLRYQREANSIDDIIHICIEHKKYLGDLESYPFKNHENIQENSQFKNYELNLNSTEAAVESSLDTDTISRNYDWLKNFNKFHEKLSGTVLFGVGCMHLLGEYGLLNLLPYHGYKLKFITPQLTFVDYTYPFNFNTQCVTPFFSAIKQKLNDVAVFEQYIAINANNKCTNGALILRRN